MTLSVAPHTLVIDARALWGSGIGRYTREITTRLARRGAFRQLLLAGDAVELAVFIHDTGIAERVSIAALAGGRYAPQTQLYLPRLALSLPADAVIWFPHWDAPLADPGRPSVVTVHDLIHLRVPGAAGALKRSALRTLLRTVTHRARTVITDAAFTRDDLAAHDAAIAGRLQVVPCGVGEQFTPGAPGPLPAGLERPYLLCVANRKPHKNLRAAVDVLAEVLPSHPTLRLAVAGEHFPEWQDVLAHAAARGVSDRVVDIPQIDDATLVALYRGASCLLFPSHYEGFGMPVLEAMACGVPVVASNVTSIPEVAGDAAILCAPDDTAAMASAVGRLLDDAEFRDARIRAGIAQAARFTWDRTAASVERILLIAAGA